MSWYSMQQDTKQHIKELYSEKAQINLVTEAHGTSAHAAPMPKPSHLLHSLTHFVQRLTKTGRRQHKSQPDYVVINRYQADARADAASSAAHPGM